MKTILSTFVCFAFFQTGFAINTVALKEPDSVFLFAYNSPENISRDGLHFAWSRDKKNWFPIGDDFSFVRSDYGRWGKEKRMMSPFLIPGHDGQWHCVWALNKEENLFAHASSVDLVRWGRQSYPAIQQGQTFADPVVQYDHKTNLYTITYIGAGKKYFEITTLDFKSYSSAREISPDQYHNPTISITLSLGEFRGQIYRVAWSVVAQLNTNYETVQYKQALHGERTQQDNQRFAGLKDIDATFTVNNSEVKPISDLLVGVFFEDINYAADGGLYAELIQNRDFEYDLDDKERRDATWHSKHSWKLSGSEISFSVDTINPVHANNRHYAVVVTRKPGGALVNTGYNGIPIKAGARYDFSFFAKRFTSKSISLLIRLVDKNNVVIAQEKITVSASEWKNVKTVLTATASADDAHLELQPLSAGSLAIDVVSLFPQQTFKGRKNGLRADLAQSIADLHPRFIRFPGGCVAHGDGLDNLYRWKKTIGPIESRKPQRNLWGYHQTAGLGYFEYFQYCEDIGAIPLPVIAAGVPCQNSATGGGGQQGGIPMNEMDEFVQDIFDLIEYANGDIKTTWGKLRAAAGHPKPFNLKYIGIGNEDLISDVFEERFEMIFNAVKQKYPEITVIGTVGPAHEGTDYEEGWTLANNLGVPMVDEHYYESPGWFIYNQDYYDKYDRSKSKVYLGEYASHLPGRSSNVETALSEALYLTALERNGDVVSMTSYAPLLAKEGNTQWNPNLIYFNNQEVKPTVGYFVQKLFGLNAGTEYLPTVISLSSKANAVTKRVGISVVRDSKSRDLILKMVNLLPVQVHSTFELKDIGIATTSAVVTVLQGDPTDEKARPVESLCTVSEKFTSVLPPYSFTVIRLKTK